MVCWFENEGALPDEAFAFFFAKFMYLSEEGDYKLDIVRELSRVFLIEGASGVERVTNSIKTLEGFA